MNSLLILFRCWSAPPSPRRPSARVHLAGDDGTRIFYRIEGAGPQTLVVVHGGPANSMESIRPDLAPLAPRRRVIYYDQRGNGRSQLVESDEGLALERHIADLEALRRHFGLERMTLFGNSWGGLLISAYAAAHPDRIERLVLDPRRRPPRRSSKRSAKSSPGEPVSASRPNGGSASRAMFRPKSGSPPTIRSGSAAK